MQAVRNKIRSRRGASLTFALLLFLVCAVVGSVVLTAGTAASGRLAELAESEQRFYAVNSAAELMVDQLCGENNKVTIRIEKDTTAGADEDTYTTTIIPSETADTELSKDLAAYLVFGTDAHTVSLTRQEFDAIELSDREVTFTVELTGTMFTVPAVLVNASFVNGYQLTLNLKNDTDNTAEQYLLPTITLETENPKGQSDGAVKEYTFNWKAPKRNK